jgi:HK97 family phage major capsid protein
VPATTAKTVAFGDIEEAYVVRQVRGAQVMRLTERYADFLQVGFLAFQRWDAKVQNTAAAKALQQA